VLQFILVVKRENEKHCSPAVTVWRMKPYWSLVFLPGRPGSKMNPSQETCLIFYDSFGGKIVINFNIFLFCNNLYVKTRILEVRILLF
jgi:hypothetical protein